MINIEKQTIKLGNKEEPIIDWRVWFHVPGKGLYHTLDEALKDSKEFVTVPVAVSDTMYEAF